MTSKLGQYLSTAVSFGSGYGIGTFLFPSNTTYSLAVAGVVGVIGIKVAWDIMPKMIMLKNIRGVFIVSSIMASSYLLNMETVHSMLLENEAIKINPSYSKLIENFANLNIGNQDDIEELEDKKQALIEKELQIQSQIATFKKTSIKTIPANIHKQIEELVLSKKYIERNGRRTSIISPSYRGWWKSKTTGCSITDTESVINCLEQKEIKELSSTPIDPKLKIDLDTVKHSIETIKQSIKEKKEQYLAKASERKSKLARINSIKNKADKNTPSYLLIAISLLIIGLIVEGGLIASDILLVMGATRLKTKSTTSNIETVMQNDNLLDILTIFANRTRSVDAINQHEYVDELLPYVIHKKGTRKKQVKADANNLLGAIFVAVNKGYQSYKEITVDEVYQVNYEEKFKNRAGEMVVGLGSTNRNKKNGYSPQEKAIRFLVQVEQKNKGYSPIYMDFDRLKQICEIYLK
jgi:hypothetical protein